MTVPWGRWPFGGPWGQRGGASVVAPVPHSVPTDYACRNWWRASLYNAATGNWPASAGSQGNTLAQANAGKRPAKTAVNVPFGSLPTVDSDGVDDTLLVTAPAMSLRPYTLGLLMRVPAAGGGIYLAGQYYAVSYQFFQMTFGTDSVSSDPASPGGAFPSAGVASVHLWLFSVSNAGSLQYELFRDGVSLGTRSLAAASGLANDFYLFSAGGGYIRAEIAEVFTLDQVVTASEAMSLTEGFRQLGYPL